LVAYMVTINFHLITYGFDAKSRRGCKNSSSRL
jgi:hypothetical protein